jgi:hypothetical protein
LTLRSRKAYPDPRRVRDGFAYRSGAFIMTQMDQASERFDKALARLETAAKAFAARAGDARMHEKLNEGLTEALQATQAEYAALRDVTGTVSQRLDDTIDRLRGMLES